MPLNKVNDSQNISNNTIAHNLMINNSYAGSFHGGGKFGVTIQDLRIEHNVIYELEAISWSKEKLTLG